MRGFDTRRRMAREELAERVIEAAMDQRNPSRQLRDSVQQFLSYAKHEQRDKARDPRES